MLQARSTFGTNPSQYPEADISRREQKYRSDREGMFLIWRNTTNHSSQQASKQLLIQEYTHTERERERERE